MDADTIPQEAGINERAVDFEKGCYVGQETVARLHHRGKPNRHLRGLLLTEPAERGTDILLGEKVVGRIGSACVSPRLGPIALALVRREAAPGDTVAVGGAEAAVGRAALRTWLSRAPRPAVTAVARELAARARTRRAGPPMTRARACSTCPPSAGATRRPTCATCASWCRPPNPSRQLDDWGRSQRVFDAFEPLLDFYYRTGSGSRPRASRTCPATAARCSCPTTPARCRRTRR